MEVKLRKLSIDDGPKMLEFFTDPDIRRNFKYTNSENSLANVEEFIRKSWNDASNVHYAIEVDNEYTGTISLKNINRVNKNAEYAIVIRKKFWGQGVAQKATKLIIDYAFKRLKLHKVYLNVPTFNVRANKFYEKMGFKYEGTFEKHAYLNNEFVDLNWYCIFNTSEEAF